MSFKIQHINLESSIARIFGKRSKERMIPLGDRVKHALEDYIVRSRPAFLSPLGQMIRCLLDGLEHHYLEKQYGTLSRNIRRKL